MYKINLAVFDMAGTTVDEGNVVYKTVQKSLAEAGHQFTLEKVLEHGAGKEKHQAIKDILATESIVTDSEKIFQNFKVKLDLAYEQLSVVSFPGVEKLIHRLRQQNIKVALNTGYSTKVALSLLNKLSWKEGKNFDILITADDVSNGRPAPDMIHLAMQKCGVTDSSKVLKAGDSVIDVEEGKNSGCGFTVGVTTGAQTREQLQTAKPSIIVDHLHEILNLIEESK